MSTKSQIKTSTGHSKAKTHRKRKQKPKGSRRPATKWTEPPDASQWDAWVAHLESRQPPFDLSTVVKPRSVHPLKWALPDEYEQTANPRLLKQLARLLSKKKPKSAVALELLEGWLAEFPAREPDDLFGLECLGWCHALPRLAAILPYELWTQLLSLLEEVVESASGISILDEPVVHQLLTGELPLTLACGLPEIAQLFKLRDSAKAALSFGVVELLDGEGMPNCRHVSVSHQLLACWTRCSMISSSNGWNCFGEEARTQYEWLVRQSLRLARSDGTLLLSRGSSGDWCGGLMDAALAESGDQLDDEIARRILPGKRTRKSDRAARKLPEPSVYSEWAEFAVMRSKWSRKSPQFTCAFGNRSLQTELGVAGRLAWSGEWTTSLVVDGQPHELQSDWTELCWFTDEDADYLELEAEFGGGWKIQRQMMLARPDQFLYVADAVLGPQSGRIEYESSFPLADDIKFVPQGETCEGQLVNEQAFSTVLPLSLPEWKTAPSQGRLYTSKNQLRLSLESEGQRLYAPLFFDLSPRRLREIRTWRQLTIAERLEIQRPDVAVGYRVQLGRSQWLIYRSLAEPDNRTLLGQNRSDEFLFARFDLDGSLDEMIEIE